MQLELDAVEQREQELVNLRALRDWTDGSRAAIEAGVGMGVEEKMQRLGRVLQDVLSMSKPGGQFTRLREEFDSWLTHVPQRWLSQDTAAHESGRGTEEGEEEEFTQGLDEAWSARADILARRLLSHRRALEMMGPAMTGSSLCRVLIGCGSMMEGSLEDVEVMRRIERQMMSCQRRWIARTAAATLQQAQVESAEDVGVADATGEAGPRRGIWQTS